MSQIEAVVEYDDLEIEDLLSVEGLGEGLVAAIESVHIVYQGILTTPAARYKEPEIIGSLTRRLETISEGTGVSLENLIPTLTDVGKLEVSQEGSFIEAIEAIVRSIIDWLGRVKQFFVNLWRKVFNRKTTVVAASKANTAKYETAVKQYATNKKEVPTTVKCNVPGRCYVLFHAKPHLPKAGFVYNQAGLDKAITSVSKEMDQLIDAMASETDTTLAAVRQLLRSIEQPMSSTLQNKTASRNIDEPLKDLKTNRKMFGLFHDKFEVIGMGVVTKPLRHATRHHSEKFALTDVSRNYGWSSVDSFDITIDVNKIKDLNDSVSKNANEKLTAIALLVDRVIKSSEINELTKKLRDERALSNMLEVNAPDTGSVTLNNSRVKLDRLELMTEYVNQLSDNLSLLYSFYARYISTLSILTQRAVVELENNS